MSDEARLLISPARSKGKKQAHSMCPSRSQVDAGEMRPVSQGKGRRLDLFDRILVNLGTAFQCA
jgi:hypothetical protein